MSQKEYFYGQTVPHEEDETGKRFYQFRIGALLALLFVILAGCATTARDAEVCYVKPMGNTEEGFIVVLQQCLTPEAFQAGQK